MNPREIIKWLNICCKDGHLPECKECPYNKDDYEVGCGKLLSDAALLLNAAYPEPPKSIVIGPNGFEVNYE